MGVSSEGQMHLNFFFRMFVATDQAMLIAALTFTVTPTTVHCASHVCISWVVLFGGGGGVVYPSATTCTCFGPSL